MISRLIATTLIIGLLSGCVRQSISYVSWEEYTDLSACWADDLNNIRAFLIVAPMGDELVPYLISTKCRILDNGHDYTIVGYHNAIRLAPDGGLLSRPQWIGRPLLSNDTTDLIPDLRLAQIYAFNGRLELLPSPSHINYPRYKISAVNALRRLPLSIEAFLEMSPEKLQQLYDRAIAADSDATMSTDEPGAAE